MHLEYFWPDKFKVRCTASLVMRMILTRLQQWRRWCRWWWLCLSWCWRWWWRIWRWNQCQQECADGQGSGHWLWGWWQVYTNDEHNAQNDDDVWCSPCKWNQCQQGCISRLCSDRTCSRLCVDLSVWLGCRHWPGVHDDDHDNEHDDDNILNMMISAMTVMMCSCVLC